MSDPLQDECGLLLVVDDNEMNRDMLSRRLTRRGHTVHVAHDGHQALDMIDRTRYDVILLDITMPGIDGVETLTRLRKKFAPTDLPVIMATAKDQTEDVVSALRAGANDYITKPLDFPVVMARVQTQLSLKRSVDRIRELEKALTQHNEKLESSNQRMQRDLSAAARIQHSGLPNAPLRLERCNVAWAYHPCEQLGGDSLNIFRLDDRHVGLYVLDVSGHGVPAALLSVTLNRHLMPHRDGSSLITSAIPEPPGYQITPPAQLARKLNGLFPMTMDAGQFFTVLYGVIDLHTLRFRFVCAGHPGPVHAQASGQVQVIDHPGFPIGVVDDADFEEAEIQLQPGDRLYLYSDGITEEANSAGVLFDRGNLLDSISHDRHLTLAQSVDALLNRVRAWHEVPDFVRDDLSILAVEVT